MVYRRLASEAVAHPALLAALIVCALAAAGVIVWQASALTEIVDTLFLGQGGWQDIQAGLTTLFFLALARALVAWFGQMAAVRLSAAVQQDMRHRMIRQLFRLGPLAARNDDAGRTMNRITEGVDRLDGWFSVYLPALLAVAVTPALLLAAVWPADAAAAAILLVTGPLIPVFMLLIGGWARLLEKRQWALLTRLGSHFLDVLQGLSTLKVFGRSREQTEIVGRMSEEFCQTTLSVLRVAFLSAFMLELLATLGTALAAVTVGFKLLYGYMGFRAALFVLILAPEFYLPFRAFGSAFHASLGGVSAADELYRFLDVAPPCRPEGFSLLEVQTEIGVTFEQVSYNYPDGRTALSDVSFSVSPGETVALVGASGAGKSTIARLLLGMFVPDRGVIRINGVDLSRLSLDDWLALVAYVPQQTHVFMGTVAENIAISRPEAPLEEIAAAARAAGIEERISRLPLGYGTVLGAGGAGLSGGEKQRIALARAFINGAPLVILDEPTASLDGANEAFVQDSLKRLTHGHTVIVIAHRLSTVLAADRVIVLGKGQVLETGNPMELAGQCGCFGNILAAYRGEEMLCRVK